MDNGWINLSKKPLTFTKWFGVLAIALIIVYLVAKWYVGSTGAIWLVPEEYVIYGALGSAIISFICLLLKK